MTATDDDRRAYWSRQMDEAHDFMMRVAELPVDECGEPPAYLPDAVDDADVEVAFSDSPVIDGVERLFYLRQGLIEPFIATARAMNDRGWVLKVEDGYRTRHIQKNLASKPAVFDAVLRTVLWETGGKKPDVDFVVRRVLALVAFCPKVGTHTSASAIDISVLRRDDHVEVDRGRPYLEISALTPMASPFVSSEAQENRRAITAVMRRGGFVEYPYEFWHYNQGDVYDAYLNRTGKPARYGPIDFDPVTGNITPIADPAEPLNSPDDIRRAIDASLKRLAGA